MNPGPATGSRRLVQIAPLLAVLLLTAATVLLWGHWKLLDQDEVFVLQTDSVSTLRTLIDVQRHVPISLDPLFYHLLGYFAVRLCGATAFAVRLPSLMGYLLMQVCLFFSARGLAGVRAGVLAAAIPALTATLFYGVEARPYGVLLGLSALIFLSWQNAVRGSTGHRRGALVTLALALAAALNTHYFAVLLLIPLYAAELFRTAATSPAEEHHGIDWPVVASIALGSAGVVFALPFQKAAGEFRRHYYNAGTVGLHAVTQSYRALLINYTTYRVGTQRTIGVVLVLLTLLLVWAVFRQFRGCSQVLPAERVYLVLLAAMPFFGFLLARFVTHSIEVRYVLPAIVAIALLVALAVAPLLQSDRTYVAVLLVLLLFLTAAGTVRVREEQKKRSALLASLAVTPQLRQRLLSTPDTRLYVQNLGFFDETTPYLPPEIRGRMVLVYSRGEELSRLRHDTVSLTATHMQQFTSVPTVRYEDLRQMPGAHLLLLHPDGWEWIGAALAQEGASVTPTGLALAGPIVSVEFPPAHRLAP